MNHMLASCLLLVMVAGCMATTPTQVASLSDDFLPQPYVRVQHPDWSKNAAIYELNLRQFTPEGTLAAASQHLPRIRDLGVDIVWLMPIHPIGEAKRKGTLGSPYAVRDYRAVNPEFGNFEDLRRFVDRAHELGMYVILDWVANHSAWDNALIENHPDWYTRDWQGRMTHVPGTDWTDVADLDYDQPGLRRYMTESLEFWVREAGVDGYRCDVAGMVPVDFWNTARKRLDAIKPVFMLAEWESRDLHAEAFDVTYAWRWYDLMHAIASGRVGAAALGGYYADYYNTWPAGAMRMTFISNHDKNTWDGTQFEQFGDALMPAIVLSVVGEGMPLLYGGQEAGNEKRLAFFEKDQITWRQHPVGALYRTLFGLLEENTALWHASWGAPMTPVPNNAPDKVFSFVRVNDRDKVFAVMNFSDRPVTVRFDETLYHGHYREHFSATRATLDAASELELGPYGYRVFVR